MTNPDASQPVTQEETEEPVSGNPTVTWLLSEGWHITSTGGLIRTLCHHLRDRGVPLWRMYCLIRTLHPTVFAKSYTWRGDTDEIQEFSAPHEVLDSALHLESPCAAIFEGASAIRCRLDIANPRLDFPILKDLHAEGATDYVVFPIPFSDGQINVLSLAAKAPGGFTSLQLDQIFQMLPALGRLLEVRAMRRTAVTLLDTYLGERTGERVLDGNIKRGDGDDIRAVIWFCDLRGSTSMAESMPRKEFLDLLNGFFDCMAGAVLDHDGEVLLFIGDAVLAIFPIGRTSDRERELIHPLPTSCANALAAAHDARTRIERLNRARAAKGQAPLDFGLALHEGDVLYGNIGVPKRLDFTVIGAAANEAARLESMCKTLGKSILLSGEFARCFPGRWVSLGRHELRGVRTPMEIFTLPD